MIGRALKGKKSKDCNPAFDWFSTFENARQAFVKLATMEGADEFDYKLVEIYVPMMAHVHAWLHDHQWLWDPRCTTYRAVADEEGEE